MGRILHDDWPVGSGENRSGQPLKYLAAMLFPYFSGLRL